MRNFQAQTARTTCDNNNLAFEIKADSTHRCLLCIIISPSSIIHQFCSALPIFYFPLAALLFHQKESSIFDPFLSSSNLLVKQIFPLDRDINNTSSTRRECHIFKKSKPAKLCLWCRMTQVLALCSLKPFCKKHPFS